MRVVSQLHAGQEGHWRVAVLDRAAAGCAVRQCKRRGGGACWGGSLMGQGPRPGLGTRGHGGARRAGSQATRVASW